MNDTDDLELAGRLVELVRREAGVSAQAEAYAERHHLALTRFANSIIHQNLTQQSNTVRLRLHLGGRTATASTSRVDIDGLTDLVRRTVAAVRASPTDPAWPAVTQPVPVPGPGEWDEATAGASPDDRAARVRDFVDTIGTLRGAGYCRTAWRRAAFANTAGHQATGRCTEAAMDGLARDSSTAGATRSNASATRSHASAAQGDAAGTWGDARAGAGVARLAGTRLSDLDATDLGLRAASRARAGADPVDLPPGEYEVVFEPTAVADLLQNLATFGFSGKAHNERRSFAQLGAAQLDPAITIVDDPAGTAALPFDLEGTPRGRLTLVDRGVTLAVAHDRRSAAEAGTTSTGHAGVDRTGFGPRPTCLRLAPPVAENGPAGWSSTQPPPAGTPALPSPAGTPALPPPASLPADLPRPSAGPLLDPSTAELVRRVRRGLLVTDLWYTRVLDPKSLVVTGLTRNGVWLIENGEIGSTVRDLRFTQSYPRALAPGAVLGVGSRATLMPDNWEAAWWCAPPLHLASWRITGGAAG